MPPPPAVPHGKQYDAEWRNAVDTMQVSAPNRVVMHSTMIRTASASGSVTTRARLFALETYVYLGLRLGLSEIIACADERGPAVRLCWTLHRRVFCDVCPANVGDESCI